MGDIEIAIGVFLAIFIGSMLRITKGVLDAKALGESFNLYKFFSTTITMFGEALLAFLGIGFSGMQVDGVGFVTIIAGSFMLGLLGSKESSAVVTKALEKTGVKK